MAPLSKSSNNISSEQALSRTLDIEYDAEDKASLSSTSSFDVSNYDGKKSYLLASSRVHQNSRDQQYRDDSFAKERERVFQGVTKALPQALSMLSRANGNLGNEIGSEIKEVRLLWSSYKMKANAISANRR
mmetsp:Transcript_24487/g.28026  ORF Transcript_24487/g.28026 Transcript_24487/m.28026 type:complete len:131 (-) Transcript_24487:69-461(-)